jgi:hypothetical protein
VRNNFLICTLLLLAVPSFAQRGMPRGSFLRAPSRSTSALVRQFDSDPEVSRRYVKIFGRTKEESRTILSRLKPKALTETHRIPVSFYNGSGKWLYETKTLEKGTVVFVTPEGKPFLKEECGNPLVDSLPYPKGEGILTVKPIRVPESLLATGPSPGLLPNAPEGAFLEPEGEVDTPTLTLPVFELAGPSTSDDALVFRPGDSPAAFAVPGLPGSDDDPFWLAILLPLLALFTGHSGSPTSTGPLGGPPPDPEPNTIPAVPENSSWMLLGAGGLAVCFVVLRRNRSAAA